MSKKLNLYYFESLIGCGIRIHSSLKQAEREILKEVGTWNGVQVCRKATQYDISSVKAMGGYIPEDV